MPINKPNIEDSSNLQKLYKAAHKDHIDLKQNTL